MRHVAPRRAAAALLVLLLSTGSAAVATEEPLQLPALIAAAEGGDADAQAAVASRYWFGDGVATDRATAVRWYRRAAEQGHADACFWLGTAYEEGLGVAADPAEAARWYRRGADAGEPYSQDALGGLYAEGRGVPQSDAEAVRWFRAAAEQGIAAGQYHLGRMVGAGRGVEKDPVGAVSWWQQAAAQGFTVAWYDLGEAYETGWGLPAADPVCAYSFYSLAADDDFALAAARRGQLAVKLGAEELAEGKRLARVTRARIDDGLMLPHCPNQPLILRFESVDVQDLLGLFGTLTGFEVSGHEDLAGKIALEGEFPDWRAALTAVLQKVGRSWERRGESLHVLPAAAAP